MEKVKFLFNRSLFITFYFVADFDCDPVVGSDRVKKCFESLIGRWSGLLPRNDFSRQAIHPGPITSGPSVSFSGHQINIKFRDDIIICNGNLWKLSIELQFTFFFWPEKMSIAPCPPNCMRSFNKFTHVFNAIENEIYQKSSWIQPARNYLIEIYISFHVFDSCVAVAPGAGAGADVY